MKNSTLKGLVLYDKRGKKYVRIRFWVHGRRREEFFGRATPENVQAAKKKLAEYRLKQTAGTLLQEMAERPVTVIEACDYFLEYKLTEPGTVKNGATKRPAWQSYVRVCDLFKEFLGSKFFHDVSVEDIRRYREWRANAPLTRWQWKKGCFGQKENGRAIGDQVAVPGKISFASINREQQIISTIFTALRQLRATGQMNFKLPPENPCRYVTKPSEDARRRTRVISVEEYDRLMTHADGPMRLIIRFALVTMLRKSDLVSLTKANYRPVTHTLEGIQSKTRLPYKVGLPTDLEEVISASSDGPILNFKDFPRRWRNLRKNAGLAGLQLRDLRRSGASWALKKCKDMALISATLGHESIEMTQRYLGTISESRQDIANTLGELFSDGKNVERVRGIEPPSLAWEARILPLNHTRKDGLPELSEKTVTQLYPKTSENSIPPTEALGQEQELGKLSFYH